VVTAVPAKHSNKQAAPTAAPACDPPALEGEIEQLIQEGLRRLRSGRVTFAVAHRLSTFTSADQILVSEQGSIVERGTQAQLLALNGQCRELYKRQHQIESDHFINPGKDTSGLIAAPRK